MVLIALAAPSSCKPSAPQDILDASPDQTLSRFVELCGTGLVPVPGKSDYAIFLHPSDGATQTSSVGKSDDYHFDTRLPSPQLIRGDAGRPAGWG